MSFTFQFKLLIALVILIAVLLVILQKTVVDKIPDQVLTEYAEEIKNADRQIHDFVSFGNSTKREFAKEIADMAGSMDDKKFLKSMNRMYKPNMKSRDEHSIDLYDSTLRPTKQLQSNILGQPNRYLSGYSDWHVPDSSNDIIQEMDHGFVKFLLAINRYPVVFLYYWTRSTPSNNADHDKENEVSENPDNPQSDENQVKYNNHIPLMIELATKYQNKSEIIRLFKQSYQGYLWTLKDTTHNLVFQTTAPRDAEWPGQSRIHMDQIYLNQAQKNGKVLLIRWESLFTPLAVSNSLFFSLKWTSPQLLEEYEGHQKISASSFGFVLENKSERTRIFVAADDLTGLTHIHMDKYESKDRLYALYYGLGLAWMALVAFIIYVSFWPILSHASYFAKLSEEFTESVDKSETKLIDYYQSVLDFYYSILAKFIPAYRQKNIKEVFQFNLNEFSKITHEMISLRDNLETQVAERTNELRESVRNLKDAQTQLIQSEKMVLLGQLTAGISHEIKNPLNFVSNFAELSMESVTELKSNFDSGNLSADDMKKMSAVLNDLISMMQKIVEHSKRADSIVKGMLLHARTGSVERVPTDINALLDEYLKLTYHGFRARDKSFNITMITDYDASIQPSTVVPQDISRVFMNLITNACYTAYEKQKMLGESFSPEIKIRSKNIGDKILIRIRDNGLGIPAKHQSKIFSPFFTTKPAGEGTGLGLSLSFDIVVNGHGGELKFESKENEYTEFTMLLPGK